MSDEKKQVLIVGGSLVGLSTALFLRRHGVDVVLAERHPGTSIHPRTPGYNPRSMELFRAAGVEEAVRAAGPWRLTGTGMLWAESLTSPNHQWFQPPNSRGPRAGFADLSPGDFAVLSQDRLEPVLRESAERLGAELRFGTELASFTLDADGVTAVLADRATDTRSTVRADYLVAADGADSSVRDRLGLGGDDPVVLEHAVSVMVRADVQGALDGRQFVICQVDNPEVSAILRVVGDMMSLTIQYDPERGETPDQFTPQRCVELARAAVGDPDLAVEPVDVLPWQPTAVVAQRFSRDRVFLAGDAAHLMPPSGAYGANTGIQDAANLAWKLAYVLRGWADPALLDTYDAERRPVAEFTVAQALATARHWFGAELPAGVADVELLDDIAVMFGYRYPTDGAQESAEDPLRPTVRPGGRLPHVWLDRDGEWVSTVDLWASGPVLLAGAHGAPWVRAAEAVADGGGDRPSLGAYRVGAERTPADVPFLRDSEARWPEATGIGDTGAVLVRPDGFVAWRADALPDEPHAALDGALRRMLGTPVYA